MVTIKGPCHEVCVLGLPCGYYVIIPCVVVSRFKYEITCNLLVCVIDEGKILIIILRPWRCI